MSNKIFLLISFLVIGFGMAGIYSYLSVLTLENEKKQTAAPPLSSTVNSKKTDKDKAEITKPSAMSSKDNHENLIKNSDTKNLSILNIWYELDPSVSIPGIHLDSRIIIEKKLGVHKEYLNMIKVGHMLEIPSTGSHRYLIKLTNKKKSGRKYELHGELQTDGRIFFSTFSIAKNNIYGLIETPDGEFNLRMSNGQGYLYKSDQLDKFINEDRNRPDVITDIPGFLD